MATAPARETSTEGRLPPHDLDAEQSVLGSILQEPAAIAKVIDYLKPEDFYRENHAEIYRACERLLQDGEPIDNLTVTSALEKQGVLERVGGRAALLLMQETVPTAANIDYYGRIVKEKSYKRQLIKAGGRTAQLGYDTAISSDDAVNEAQSLIYTIAEDRIKRDFEQLYDLLRPAWDRVEKAIADGKGVIGIPSGFDDLDRLTSGFKGGEFVVIAGRPGMGKTSILLNLALHIAMNHKVPIAMFSLEMSKEQLVERLLCENARIDAQRMHRGLLSEAEYDRLARSLGPLSEAPIFIDDSPTLDELAVVLKSRQIQLREKVGMILVDYLQLMQGRSRSDDSNRVQEVSAISRALKAVARELNIPVVAISQLSRAVEQRQDKRPLLSDLRESGAIEQDADMVMFLYRADYYKEDDRPGIAEVILAKNRNGPTGKIELKFVKDQTRFYNLESRRPEPAQ